MTEDREKVAVGVTEFVTRIEQSWVNRGMPPAKRRQLVAELESDLAEAIANGATLDSVMPDSPDDFASELAAAHGIELPPSQTEPLTARDLVQSGVLGGLAGALAAWILVYQGLLFYAVVGTPGKMSLLAEYAFLMSLHVTVAALASVAPIMAFAWLMQFSLSPLVLIMEFGMAGLFCGAAIVLVARRRLGLSLT